MLASGSGVPVWLVFFAGITLVALALYGYRRVFDAGFPERWAPRLLLGLRLAALVLCVLMVANPVLRINQTPRDSQGVAILVDTSRSMSIHDSLAAESRSETASRILKKEGLLNAVSSMARTDLIAFDTVPRSAEIDKLAPLGEASDISRAIVQAREKKDKTPLAAIVLITDGCETSPKSAADLSLGIPVYPIGLGSLHEALKTVPDVALTGVKADRETFINTKVAAKIELRETNLAGERVTVQLLRDGKVLAEDSVVLEKDITGVTLNFTPEEAGLFDLEARVVPHPKEKIVENNSRFFPMRVSAQKIKVFYYEGTPRWSYKFLTRELKQDSHIGLQAVLRTNTDRVYQSTTQGTQAATFPSTRAELKAFDCVILGDLKAQELTPQQGALLNAYVEEDGGGLIVLGGKESFSPSGLPALGMEAMLPVSLAGVRQITGNFAVSATQEGAAHPAFAGLSRFLPIESLYVVSSLKPGAQLLAQAEAANGTYPLAVSQRYGAGRVFVFASDADWKWVMKYKLTEGNDLFVRFWGQVIRWSANRSNDAAKQGQTIVVSTDKEIYRPGEGVKVFVQGGGLAEVSIENEKVPLHKSLDRMEGDFTPKHAGLHRVNAGDASCEFLVERAAGEFDRVALNDMMLRQLASGSGGQYFDATTARSLPEVLRTSGTLKMEMREYVYCDSWIPFVLILLALATEWSLRKRMQIV